MLKHILIAIAISFLFFVGIQFGAVYFYALEFDDFVRDEVKFTPMREPRTRGHLVEHITEQAKYYGLILDKKTILVSQGQDRATGITKLSVDLEYSSPVDLYYFTTNIRRHLHATSTY